MSEPLLGWTTIAESRLQRRLLLTAAILCAATSSALAAPLALALPMGSLRWTSLAVAALLAAVACATLIARLGRLGQERSFEVAVDRAGTIRLRVARGPEDRSSGDLTRPFSAPVDAVPCSLAPFVLVLQAHGRHVSIWRDSVPAMAFRRLAAVARWRVEREPQREPGLKPHENAY